MSQASPRSSSRAKAESRPKAHPQVAFGTRIRELRLERELTQDDLATHCGLFRTYMSRIETGNANPTLTMICALADALGVTVAELFPLSTPPTPARGSNRKQGNLPSRGRVR